MGIYDLCAKNEGELIAFHPGPNLSSPPPEKPRESDQERLKRYERELLERAIERHLRSNGRMGELAIAITSLRATVAA
jgi:hypothetical protein